MASKIESKLCQNGQNIIFFVINHLNILQHQQINIRLQKIYVTIKKIKNNNDLLLFQSRVGGKISHFGVKIVKI